MLAKSISIILIILAIFLRSCCSFLSFSTINCNALPLIAVSEVIVVIRRSEFQLEAGLIHPRPPDRLSEVAVLRLALVVDHVVDFVGQIGDESLLPSTLKKMED